MHEKIDEIKKMESKPKIIKNIFSKIEIKKFLDLYEKFYAFTATFNELLEGFSKRIFLLMLL